MVRKIKRRKKIAKATTSAWIEYSGGMILVSIPSSNRTNIAKLM
ncbi:MAG: hypothetical protein RMJ81_05825 [Candidatus Kryptonium sp.]|nr:hypothetical protein [Candidatus Kryptonium sp.]MCX7763229.1 hypothetical protein [Candidatus Kryptonium sp.]MDW8109157.1 hypothetical protein [Candidatus Kryptonium sp.]